MSRSVFLLTTAVATLWFFPGCTAVPEAIAGPAMRKQNEQDLRAGRQTPKEYQDRRDEINRRLP